ncbi:FAD-containing monooxygenase [Podosphaera aphanis]|nr:FAD-containing monooxygenase [Podosphaera aphanis]
MEYSNEHESKFVDVLIIGAGISGINAGYRIQSELPNHTYAIIEARDTVGGTWDLFRYPGIRSDSDLNTFGFPWRPWLEEKSIADGESIRKYIRECAAAEGIDRHIRFKHRVLSGNWSTSEKIWDLLVDADGVEITYKARFVIFGTGYYNYKEPLKAQIPGIENFKGTVIHPQFWPEDLDYTDKKIVVIGSGATAITLVPNLADKAAHVTMLQRSPTYILAAPAVDKISYLLRRVLPLGVAVRIARLKFLVVPFCFVQFCRAFPGLARKLLRANAKAHLPAKYSLDPHFNPKYNPWEQRLCLSPDGDFYASLHSGKASVVTDVIDTVTETEIRTSSGQVLEPDIIITATGLQLQLAGGASITIDKKPVDVTSKYFWKGCMLQDLPNAAFVVGYTNASWTLGADSTAMHICRLLKYMDRNNYKSVCPHMTADEEKGMQTTPMLNLTSTYIENAKNMLPKSGDKGPWHAKRNYFVDSWDASWSDLKQGLLFSGNTKAE